MDLSALEAQFGPMMQRKPVGGGFGKPGQQRGRGGTLTSLISEGGATGGAIAGATIGSAVPVVGTAIGGILGAGIGAFGGRIAENKVRDNRVGLGDAAKEGALSAALAGPLKALKYGKSALAAKAGGETLEKALMTGADDATKFSLRSSLGKKVDEKATSFATKQFGLTDDYIAKFTKNHREDAGKVIKRYGFGSEDDVINQIKKQDELFSSLVENAGSIKAATVRKKLNDIALDIMAKAPTDQKKVAEKLFAETDHLLTQFGDEVPASVLNKMKQEYADLVDYARTSANPMKSDVNRQVAKGLREVIQDASGSNQLKETGHELSKLIDLSEEIAKRAPKVASRAASPFGMRNMLGATIGAGAGGMAGGLPGAAAGMALTAAVNSPTGRRTLAKGAQGLSQGMLRAGGGAVSPLGMGAKTLATQPLEGMMNNAQTGNAQSLEESLVGGQGESFGPNSSQSMLNSNTTTMTPNIDMGQSYNATLQQSSPYSKENLLADIQRDPQNAKEYIAYYKELDEIFNMSAAGGLKLGNPAIARISDFESGLNALDGLGGRIQESGVNNPVIGALRRANPFDTEAGDLNSEIRTVRQLVGKALEGGVLRKEDEVKYEQMLPKIGDTDAVAARKIENVRNLLATNLNAYKTNQQYYSGNPSSIEDVMMQGGMY